MEDFANIFPTIGQNKAATGAHQRADLPKEGGVGGLGRLLWRPKKKELAAICETPTDKATDQSWQGL
eukprot:2553394-Prorocentrum_lima.AAC.1